MIKKVLRMLKKRIVTQKFVRNVAAIGNDNTITATASIRNFGGGNSGGVSVGNHNTIGGAFLVYKDGQVRIGDNVYIGSNTIFECMNEITVEDNCIIANDVLLIDNNNHPVDPELRNKMSQCNNFLTDELWSWAYAANAPIVIHKNVWIGRDVRIMKGVTIGEGSVVALGAIVTHDVPPYTGVDGNPAKPVKSLQK